MTNDNGNRENVAMMISEEQTVRIENLLGDVAEALVDMKLSLRDEGDDAPRAFIEAATEINERVNSALLVFLESVTQK